MSCINTECLNVSCMMSLKSNKILFSKIFPSAFNAFKVMGILFYNYEQYYGMFPINKYFRKERGGQSCYLGLWDCRFSLYFSIQYIYQSHHFGLCLNNIQDLLYRWCPTFLPFFTVRPVLTKKIIQQTTKSQR